MLLDDKEVALVCPSCGSRMVFEQPYYQVRKSETRKNTWERDYMGTMFICAECKTLVKTIQKGSDEEIRNRP